MKITVKVFLDGNQTFGKTFDEGVYRVGRSDFSDVVLSHDSVSRSHFELRVTEATVYVTNMSGAGKLKVNGRLVETAEVQSGDEVQVGPFKLLFFSATDEAEASGMADPSVMDNQEALQAASPDEAGFGEQGEAQVGAEPVEGLIDGLSPDEQPINAGASSGGFQAEASPAMVMDAPLSSEGTQALNRAETQIELKPVVAKIVFTEGPRTGEEMFLEAYEITLGRSKKADIFLDDEKLSRVHAKITRVGMGYRLIDLSSRNGTYVNGMRVLEHPLNSFDEIAIGNTKIKFLIHDMVASDMARQQGGTLVAASPLEQTKSFQMDPEVQNDLVELASPVAGRSIRLANSGLGGGGLAPPVEPPVPYFEPEARRGGKAAKIVAGMLLLLLVTYLIIPSEKEKTAGTPATTAAESGKNELSKVKLPPTMPDDYKNLTPESQRQIEGYFNAAQQLAEKEKYEEAVAYLKRIHEVIDYYKNSKELQDQYLKKVKEKQVAEAQEKAKRDEKKDLAIYLEDGMEYLKEGDFERAAEAFNSAIIIDPTNTTAIQGLKAAEYKVRRIEDIPPERDPEQEKRKLVAELFQKAVTAFTNKGYQEAIDTAEKIRQIELKGDTQYLNEAKQIIDRARMLQKEEFEPFYIQAKEKFAEGDYNASRDLCEEMLKRDSAYEEAKECVLKARKQLNRLAKEAYTHGYILESMNRIEEAKQYWNRAKNYVRSGDEYYDKVTKKLEYYQ